MDGIPILSLEDGKAQLRGKSVILGAATHEVEEEMRNLLLDSSAEQIFSISELILFFDLSRVGWHDRFDYSEILDAILKEGLLKEYLYHLQVWENTCRYFQNEFERILKEYQTPGRKLADVACGYGIWSLFFADRGFEVLGIDCDASRLNVFRRVAKSHPNMTALDADIRNMDCIPDNSQDISFCAHTIHVVPDWRKVISEMNRITRSKGIIILAIGRTDHLFLQNIYHGLSIIQWDATLENIIEAAAPEAELTEAVDIYTDEALQFSKDPADAILIFAKR